MLEKYSSFTINKVSGDGSPADPTILYGRSKLANVLFARKLARKYPNVFSCSVHPGMVATQISRYASTATKLAALPLKMISKTPWQGAQTSLHSTVELTNGGYYEECEIKIVNMY